MKVNKIFQVSVFPLDFSESCTIEGQSFKIKDLLERFSRGQRLNITQRPINILQDGDHDETLDFDSPLIDDPVDAEEYLEYVKRKREYLKHNKKVQNKTSESKDIEKSIE